MENKGSVDIAVEMLLPLEKAGPVGLETPVHNTRNHKKYSS